MGLTSTLVLLGQRGSPFGYLRCYDISELAGVYFRLQHPRRDSMKQHKWVMDIGPPGARSLALARSSDVAAACHPHHTPHTNRL